MRLRARLEKRSASSVVFETPSTGSFAFRPINHGGNRTEVYVDLAEPGGIQTMSLLISPRSTASRCSIRSLWCAAGTKPSCRYSMKLARLRLAWRLFSSSIAASCGDIDEVCVTEILWPALDKTGMCYLA